MCAGWRRRDEVGERAASGTAHVHGVDGRQGLMAALHLSGGGPGVASAGRHDGWASGAVRHQSVGGVLHVEGNSTGAQRRTHHRHSRRERYRQAIDLSCQSLGHPIDQHRAPPAAETRNQGLGPPTRGQSLALSRVPYPSHGSAGLAFDYSPTHHTPVFQSFWIQTVYDEFKMSFQFEPLFWVNSSVPPSFLTSCFTRF